MTALYQPGEDVALVTDQAVIVTHAAMSGRLLDLADRKVGSLDVISALSGGDLASLPDFAAVLVDGADLVSIVRGGYSVTAEAETHTGAGTATWIETRVPGGAERQAEVRVGSGHDVAGLDMPIAGGVVHASLVWWTPQPERPPSPKPAELHAEAPAMAAQASVTLPGGARMPFSSVVIIGRVPQVADGAVGVVIDDPHVSSSHVQIELKIGVLTATDLSTNGTMLAVPGDERRFLAKGDPTAVPSGSTLWITDDLGLLIELENLA